MSVTNTIRGSPSSQGFIGRTVPVRFFHFSASAIRPGKYVGVVGPGGHPLRGPFDVFCSMSSKA
jgi:hypothetical protein